MEMNIMIAADNIYLYPSMVLLTSLFHQHRHDKMTVYFLQTGLAESDIRNIQKFQKKWEQKEIILMEVMEKDFDGLKSFDRFSVAAFFRILGMKLLPGNVKKVLYLDTDMVVNQNLSALFAIEQDAPIFVCYDINNELQGNIDFHKRTIDISEDCLYFNSGMLFMDLEYMRENNVAERLIKDIKDHFEQYRLVDQDALNKMFYKDAYYLPWEKYNCPCVPFFVEKPGGHEKRLLEYATYRNESDKVIYDITEQIIQQAAIIHFCTSQKPWRDRDFYKNENMSGAYKIYQRYERIFAKLSR